VFGPVICASLMRKNIWYPIGLGLALHAVSNPAAFVLPETLNVCESREDERVAAYVVVTPLQVSRRLPPRLRIAFMLN
jgi:hypothetical protein